MNFWKLAWRLVRRRSAEFHITSSAQIHMPPPIVCFEPEPEPLVDVTDLSPERRAMFNREMGRGDEDESEAIGRPAVDTIQVETAAWMASGFKDAMQGKDLLPEPAAGSNEWSVYREGYHMGRAAVHHIESLEAGRD